MRGIAAPKPALPTPWILDSTGPTLTGGAFFHGRAALARRAGQNLLDRRCRSYSRAVPHHPPRGARAALSPAPVGGAFFVARADQGGTSARSAMFSGGHQGGAEPGGCITMVDDWTPLAQRRHPHADAVYRIIETPERAYGVEVAIPDSSPAFVTSFATEDAAEAMA